MKLGIKLTLTVSMLVFVGLVLAAVLLVVMLNNQTASRLRQIRDEQERAVTQKLAAELDVLTNWLTVYAASGGTPEQAKELIRNFKFEKTSYGYFWIYAFDPAYPNKALLLMHPNMSDLENTDVSELRDRATSTKLYYNGHIYDDNDPHVRDIPERRIFLEMNEQITANGEGVVRYYWPKPTESGGLEDVGYLKLSYVKYFPRWGWVIGTGQYVDEIDRIVLREQAKARKSAARIIGLMLSLLGLLQVVELFIVLDILAHKRTEETLAELTSSIANLTSTEYFTKVARYLAQSVGVSIAFIGELSEDGTQLKVHGGVHHGESLEPFYYRLAGTPCQTVIGQALRSIPKGVHTQFPQAQLINELKVESYLGAPLFDRKGAALGLVVLMDTKPMIRVGAAKALLKLLCERIAVELEHQRSKAAAIRSFERLSALVEASPLAIVVINLEGHVLDWNPAAVKMFGYAKEEVVGKLLPTHADVTGKDMRNIIKSAILGESVSGLEQKRYKRDGTEVDVSVSTAPLRDPDGQIVGVIGILQDITQRKRSEESLRRLSAAIEQASEAVLVTDARGHIVFTNPAFTQMIGYSASQALAMQLGSVGGTAPLVMPPAALEAMSNGNLWKGRFTAASAAGEPLQIEASLAPIRNAENKLTGNVILLRNVTQEVKLEGQLRQTQKLEAIGNLAGGIAHDFNNLLFAILGNAELLEEELAATSTARTYLEAISIAASRAQDLVRQILTFSRKSERTLSTFNPGSVAREVFRLLRATLPTTIDLRLDYKECLSTVCADPIDIHQVLMNLCTNAAHSISDMPGVISIVLRDVYIDEEFAKLHINLTPGNYVQLEVSDSGHGIKPEYLDRIFEPFFTTKERGEGTGMGLSVVHGIVTRLEGAISVYSEMGMGTLFHVYVPAVNSSEEQIPEPVVDLPRGSARILVVDDEPLVAAAIQGMLEHLGYSVHVETSSVKAMALFEAQPDRFDLLLTDQTMPQMTGSDLAVKVMQIRPELPVILCTGFSQAVSAERASELGVWGFMQKPISRSQLAHTVANAILYTEGIKAQPAS